ncbi:hypothetical protein Tco_1575814 [Tanacetum coccineum]
MGGRGGCGGGGAVSVGDGTGDMGGGGPGESGRLVWRGARNRTLPSEVVFGGLSVWTLGGGVWEWVVGVGIGGISEDGDARYSWDGDVIGNHCEVRSNWSDLGCVGRGEGGRVIAGHERSRREMRRREGGWGVREWIKWCRDRRVGGGGGAVGDGGCAIDVRID